ncbi:MAG TPA: PLP-dependent aminotransferase family protein [Polyangiaceae bacterium]|nr:PLP-dependent aminotransferase family protein [Polyangiaceae bacterium]
MTSKVERLLRATAARSDVHSFAGGLPDPKMFPRVALTRSFLQAIGARDAPALQYGWPEGRPGLREFIAGRLQRRGCRVHADDVLVTSGAQQAIAIATELVFHRSKTVALDAETYPGALELFRARGLEITLDPAGARAAYVMPQIDNPRGQVMSERTRRHLLQRARREKLLLIEDDAYADIVFAGSPSRPLFADAPESAFHIGTFSKSLCPGLRVGWLVTPRRFRERALEVKRESDLQANSLAQAILEAFFRQQDFDARVAKACQRYRRRAARLSEALRRHLPEWSFAEPQGGFSIWVDTGEPGDDVALLEMAVAFGTSFDPGSMFRAAAASTVALRLCYSCLDENAIEDGVKRLRTAWRALARPGRGPRSTSEQRGSALRRTRAVA